MDLMKDVSCEDNPLFSILEKIDEGVCILNSDGSFSFANSKIRLLLPSLFDNSVANSEFIFKMQEMRTDSGTNFSHLLLKSKKE